MLTICPVDGIPEIVPGTNLGATVADAMRRGGTTLIDGDVVVVTSKVVSKSEDLFVVAGDRSALTLQEARSVVTERATTGAPTRVVESVAGPVMAGAGIDASNAGDDRLLLLPRDPDASAARIHAQLQSALPSSVSFGLVLSDTSGRPWRAGVSDFALGVHGLDPLDDLRGRADTEGRDLAVTIRNLADEIAAAADLVKGKLERVPVAVVRGLAHLVTTDTAQSLHGRDLVRSGPSDWFGLGRAEAVRAALGVPPGTPRAAAAGLESVHPEPLLDRVRRASRVALSAGDPADAVATHLTDERAEDGTVELLVAGADPVVLGRVWARHEVALAGERLTSEVIAHGPQSVRLHVRG
ncbi:coenzyme F420-0:L-glutamate ligase [Leekyejoonella antrihumi]|uniref:Coenzyme F420:L-glutamate ligase-like domain-containing protein n=1 Tax=Leekyejoonella antrihumi TaxID=1660198 RepID=A0A563DXY7_9MICO|nr:coenzyme F420-0:L-glutamate ligase [Leekyejoonella antrihumi]TWP35086.1 hypothetical protein FGL98_15135 [Leekyejoonella antrihumi]